MRAVVVIAAALSISACASTAPTSDRIIKVPARSGPVCDATGLQDHLGHTATQQSGAKLLELSGAHSLRWGPPDSAWTMDYREDRLNVRYDHEMKITAITCG